MDDMPYGIETMNDDGLKKLGLDTSKLHLISDMSRVGVKLFNVKLEYTHFAPRSGMNNLFEMSLLKWPKPDNLFFWAIVSIPIEYRPEVEKLIVECGLRLGDGVPTLMTNRGLQHFPMSGPTVFTLENEAGHPIYNNDFDEIERLKRQHEAEINAIIDADRKKLFDEMWEQGYTKEQIVRIVRQWDSGNEQYEEPPLNASVKDGQHRHQSIKKE